MYEQLHILMSFLLNFIFFRKISHSFIWDEELITEKLRDYTLPVIITANEVQHFMEANVKFYREQSLMIKKIDYNA